MQIKKKKDAIFTPKHPKMKNIEDQTINSNFSTSNVTSGDIKSYGFDSIFQEFVSDLNEIQKNIFNINLFLSKEEINNTKTYEISQRDLIVAKKKRPKNEKVVIEHIRDKNARNLFPSSIIVENLHIKK